MKKYRQRAINELYFNGIGISNKAFDLYIKEYNQYSMPFNDLYTRIVKGKEPKFIDFVKGKIKQQEEKLKLLPNKILFKFSPKGGIIIDLGELNILTVELGTIEDPSVVYTANNQNNNYNENT